MLSGLAVLMPGTAARGDDAGTSDKVTVMPFTVSPSAPPDAQVDAAELARARAWTRAALTASGHPLPSASEELSGEMAVSDGVTDTSDECRAAGRASGAPWTVTGRMEKTAISPTKAVPGGPSVAAPPPSGTSYRLELEACQVASGRVESLARTVHPERAEAEVREMLALLVRPEGIATAPIPWADDDVAPPLPTSAPLPPASPPPSPSEPPPASAAPKAVAHAYGEGHPVALGASVGVSAALARPSLARGSSFAVPVGGVVAYALERVPGLEFRGMFAANVVGPQALEVAGGARYMWGVLPEHRVFVGPELTAGALVALGAAKDGRFLTRGALVGAWGVDDRVQLELAADLAAAFGGSGSLVLGGATARALVRF